MSGCTCICKGILRRLGSVSTSFRSPQPAVSSAPTPAFGACTDEPAGLTYRQAREILRGHDSHGPGCRQWLVAAAYLSAGLDDE